MTEWKRPENIPYPQVWSRFKAKDLDSEELVEYRIQDLPEDRFEDALEHMSMYFIYDEPLCKCKDLTNDHVSFEEIKELWRKTFRQKISVVCFKEGSDEIVGMNALSISFRDDKSMPQFKGKGWDEVFRTLVYVTEQFDLYEHYGVDKYITAYGLSVQPKYRGRNISVELLKARIPLGKAIGIKLTSTVFTATVSQKVAAKVGFEENCVVYYIDLATTGPKVDYTNITSPCSKLMSIKIY